MLASGQSSGGLLADVWEYDGTSWRNVTPAQPLTARAGHSAAYDPDRGVVVVMGGRSDANVWGDTWEWDGVAWRERVAATPLSARHRMAVAYDGYRAELVAFGGETDAGVPLADTQLHRATGTLVRSLPIATINRMLPRNARQGSDTILFEGSGADQDSSDVIQAYRWSYLDERGKPVIFSTERSLSWPASEFPLGTYSIQLEVQDDEGQWSQPIAETLTICNNNGSCSSRPTWTMLIYAAADNNLDPWMGSNPDINGMLYRLKRAGAQANVQVGVLYDGPGANDTRRYTLSSTGEWRTTPIRINLSKREAPDSV